MNIEKKTNLIIKAIKKVCYKDNEKYPISLHEPNFKNSNSLKYLKDCIETGWVSSSGEFVKRFEQKICEYTNAKYCRAVASGTVALRLGLHIIGVSQNDEVLFSSLNPSFGYYTKLLFFNVWYDLILFISSSFASLKDSNKPKFLWYLIQNF